MRLICMRKLLRSLASRADNGSSNKSKSGSITNALASATRCFCPPDKDSGFAEQKKLTQPNQARL